MNKYLHAGRTSALALALFFGLGDSSAALAQQAQIRFPVIQAVVSTPLVQPIFTPFGMAQPAMPASPATPQAQPAPLPLSALVDAQAAGPSLDEQGQCLATAVYFESMGEPLQGQLAVANVVINRARSGLYPDSWCGVVRQKAQFSFVRNGRFPHIDSAGAAWRKAQAIARIASANLAQALPDNVLWYHADYVAPSWGRRLTKVEKIGAHIFYRA